VIAKSVVSRSVLFGVLLILSVACSSSPAKSRALPAQCKDFESTAFNHPTLVFKDCYLIKNGVVSIDLLKDVKVLSDVAGLEFAISGAGTKYLVVETNVEDYELTVPVGLTIDDIRL
jgi:hypothetical protein